jgi:GntR family transcriptional regulator of vanillate catabolism
MSHRMRSRKSAQTPIEAIFERVMRRRMTPKERVYFQLRAPIENMFSDIFKREMTPAEREILLAEPVEAQGPKRIASEGLSTRAGIPIEAISHEKSLRLGATQVSRAVMELRELLLRGVFRRGERIAEIAMAARLGVSRTPLRLAFERLANEGLLQALPHAGFAAKEFSPDDIWQAIEARSILEGAAARMAAERSRNSARLDTLRQIDHEVEASLKEDIEVFANRYLDLNEAFHSAILDLADNRVLRREVEKIWRLPFVSPRAIILLYQKVPTLREIIPIAQEQHRGILRAIERGEGARAESLACEHTLMTRRNLEIAMGDESFFDMIPGSSLVKLRSAGGI